MQENFRVRISPLGAQERQGLIARQTPDNLPGAAFCQPLVPLLGDIPVIGNLFKATSDNMRRTELLVLLTPRVVRDSNDARTVTQELCKRLRSLAPLDTKIQ